MNFEVIFYRLISDLTIVDQEYTLGEEALEIEIPMPAFFPPFNSTAAEINEDDDFTVELFK